MFRCMLKMTVKTKSMSDDHSMRYDECELKCDTDVINADKEITTLQSKFFRSLCQLKDKTSYMYTYMYIYL